MAIGKSSSTINQNVISIKIGNNYVIKNGEILIIITKRLLQNI